MFSGEVTFPGSLVFYQLRGHDIQANSFAHVIPGTERRFKSPSLALSLANFDRMPVNPGISSFHKLWLQYTDDSGPTLKPFLQAGEPQGVSLQYYQLPTSIGPSERRLVVVELTGSSMLTVGNNLTLTANVTENCTDVAVKSSYLVTVYQPLPLSVANITSTGKRSLVVHWNPLPGLDVHRYKLILDYDNGTVITTFLTPTTLTTITDILTPYQRMFISLAVINSSGDIVAFAAPRPFRSREGGKNIISIFTISSVYNNTSMLLI